MKHNLKPSEGLFAITKHMFKDALDQRQRQSDGNRHVIRPVRKALDKQTKGLLDQIADAEIPAIITAYEKRLDKIEREKLVLDEVLKNQGPKRASFENAKEFLSSPCIPLESENFTLPKVI